MSEQNLNKILESLNRVNDDTKKLIFDIATSMSEIELIQIFNHQTSDFFNAVHGMIRKMGKEREYTVGAYKALFDSAVKINAKKPIDKYALVILEYAAEIYQEDADCFLNMTVPDTTVVSVGNEFNLIRSEMFKTLWKQLNINDRDVIKEKMILLTTYAHAYFYKIILLNKKRGV